MRCLSKQTAETQIAFVETGVGKILIAVSLIKSIYDKMIKENKKMFAVFLVPKVPLVYQVQTQEHAFRHFVHKCC